MQKIAILYDASQAVLSTFRLDEVLHQILAIMRDYFQLQHGAVLILNERTQMLEIKSHSGWLQEGNTVSIPVGVGLIGNAAKLKRPLYSQDVSKDPRYVPRIPTTRSELAIPLLVREKVVGVLDCQSDGPGFFDNETIDLLTLFSTQASIAIQNAHLYSLERRRATQLEAINAIARQTTTVLDIRELLDKVCMLVVSSFDVDHVSVLLNEGDSLVLRAHEGVLTPAVVPEIPVPASTGLYGRALTMSFAMLENEIAPGGDLAALCEEAQSEICLPLVAMGQPLGVLVLDSKRKNAFDPTEIQPLQSVADICAGAIQNAHYFEQVRQLAYRDGLTSVFNRRYFESQILQEISRAERYEGTLSVLMLDLDGFKKLNDEFGHLLGDEVLRRVSAIFSENLRKSDILCRYGGDEFAVLLPSTAGQNATKVAEKLRAAVASCEFPGVPRPVTLTIGVAAYPLHGRDRDDLIKAADNALYAAKQAGRNRVVCATKAATLLSDGPHV